MLLKWLLLLSAVWVSVSGLPCILKKFPRGFVCVCNGTYCDTLDDYIPKLNQFVSVSSTDGGLRFNVFRHQIHNGDYLKIPYCLEENCEENPEINSILMTPLGMINVSLPSKEKVIIDVDATVQHQKIHGFGGAYTGSVTEIVSHMPEDVRKNFYKAYYSADTGIGFKFMRWSIGSSDFDLEQFVYNETPENDHKLTNMTELHPYDVKKVEQLKELIATTNTDVKIIASAWGPPMWTKTNNANFGFGFLKIEHYQTWADYHLKYLELMDKNGVKHWALGTANEIYASFFTMLQSLRWLPYNYAVWLGDYLCPTIRSSKFKNIKLFLLDDQRYILPHFIDEMERANDKFMKNTDGIALHWYSDKRTILYSQTNIRKKYSDKLFFMTESSICAVEDKHLITGPRLGDWKRGLIYIDLMIENFNHGLDGWIDWNLMLDEQGGPKHPADKYFCDAAIISNMTHHEFYKQPIYYVFGHFSKFLIDGTVRIDMQISHSSIEGIAFLRPDNLVVVIINNPFYVMSPIDVVIRTNRMQKIHMEIPSYSIHTVLYWTD